MRDLLASTKISVGPQGRLVIPSEIRRELGIAPGDVLIAMVDDQRLVLVKREAVLQRLRRRFAHIPTGISLADELIAERRAESKREI
ncbi:MAG TPA: AbrB/MazE/SpoVT family DNA-binding domain-containing protein [Thermoanaerobaculia bacterium]|jgi:AbrB family looped-hinge helix DNA binding protein|nr:AbrB/MazE/SpoVT family DNA-binding domain-containing protein [Thermoanaerobaculia bacterium]